MKKIINWFNKPLPVQVCYAAGKGPHCKICWLCTFVICGAFGVAIYFS